MLHGQHARGIEAVADNTPRRSTPCITATASIWLFSGSFATSTITFQCDVAMSNTLQLMRAHHVARVPVGQNRVFAAQTASRAS